METVHDTLQQIDVVNRLISAFPRQLQHAYSTEDIWSNFKTSPGRISSLMGAEGLHQIGNSASILRLYHRLGVRYITLTHDCNNKYADAALAPVPAHSGLSSAGKELILEMNRLGMLIDLSHTSEATMKDVLNTTTAPVMFSHSNAQVVCDHVRNVPDSVLHQVRDNGGVVMVSFYADYISCDNPAFATLSVAVDHIVYIGRLIGFEHVGIGSDFDGMLKGPANLEDASKYPELINELFNRGVNMKDVKNLVDGSVLRVLSEAENIAERMVQVPPLEDRVEPMPH